MLLYFIHVIVGAGEKLSSEECWFLWVWWYIRTFSSSIQGAENGENCKFKASLISIMSSRTARVTH